MFFNVCIINDFFFPFYEMNHSFYIANIVVAILSLISYLSAIPFACGSNCEKPEYHIESSLER